MTYTILEWGGTVSSLFGALGVAYGYTWGFVVFLVADILLGICAFHSGHIPLLTLFGIYGIINIVAIIRRKKR